MNDDRLHGDDPADTRSPENELESTPTDESHSVSFVRNEPTSTAVVRTVASELDADPIALEPLHYSIDTDALDTLFPSSAEKPADDVEVTFSFADCRVTVEGTGRVLVEALESD